MGHKDIQHERDDYSKYKKEEMDRYKEYLTEKRRKDRKDIDPRKPVPSDQYGILQENLNSGFADGFPVFGLSQDNRASMNKASHTTRKDDTIQDISIGLQDHDEAISYYFNNVIKPSVIVGGNRTNVPIMYGAPERWKSVQQDGFFRDKEGKIQTPLIMFKRDSVEKRRDLGNKLDANNPQFYYSFQERYSKRNRYDNFAVLQGRKPQIEKYAVVIPDYVKLQYTCNIWTDYVAQMNKLIEMINYASDSYWGDGERFKFNAKIDTYSNTTEVSQGTNRVVKTSFGLTLNGYLVSDSLNQELASGNINKSYSKSIITFNPEIAVSSTGAPQTREEVRGAPLGQNIAQVGLGIGYQEVGLTNQIA